MHLQFKTVPATDSTKASPYMHINMGTHAHAHAHTHTHTHTYTHRRMDVKSSAIGYAPPPPPPIPPQTNYGWDSCALLQGTLGVVLDKLLRPGQGLAGALTMPLQCGVGTRSPTCTSVGLGTASGLVLPQPKPGPQFFTWAWVGCQVEKVFGVSIFTTSSKTTLKTKNKTELHKL